MTNMYPQHGSLNRGIWKLLETSVRGWSVQLNQSFTVYVGAMYGAGDPSIGNGVIVPHGYYKIVINNNTKQVAGWMFPHTKPYVNLGNDLTKFRMSITDIQKQAGVQYAFPQGAVELQPGQEWKVDFGALTQAKRNKCGANAKDD
jgi:endonuclease G